MAQAFNLTAQLNLRGPSNVRQIVGDIRRQLGTVQANVQLRLDPSVARNVAGLNNNLRALNATLANTTTNANNAARAMRTFGTSVSSINLRNVPQQLNATVNSINRLNRTSSSVSSSITSASSEMAEFGKQAGLAVRRFAAFSGATGVIFGLTSAITKGIQAFVEYDKQFVKLQQVTGESANGLKGLAATISSLATQFGVASSDITNVASTLAQAGLSAKDTERALKALTLSSLAPSFDDMNQTVEGSIALMRQFGISASDLEKALGSVNSVAAKFAVESSDIITAIQRTGGVFASASKGVSEGTDALNEFIAVFTSVRATTRESAETIATGLRTIFTRIQRGGTINALKQFGVDLTDAEGKFVGAYKAVELLSKGLNSIDPRDLKFSQIVEELGGFRQIGKVIPLIQQFATAQEALKVAQKGQGSLAADAAKAQESLANRVTKVKEEFFALFREIGNSKGFQTMVRGALDLASALIKVADSVKGVIPVLGVLAAFKGASALTQFGAGFVGAIRGQRKNSGGYIRKYAGGGYVPGVGDSDTVPALLTPGEFVIRKKAVQTIGANNLQKMNKYGSGGRVKFSKGGFSQASLVDDITSNAKQSMLPNKIALEKLIQVGYGALDFDRTLKRTVGDSAYGKAKTSQQRDAVLSRYFRNPTTRLSDATSAPITSFGKQLLEAIKAGKVDPRKLSIISKSSRTPGLAEHIQELFGIPKANMIFTAGGSKEPALSALQTKGPRVNRVFKSLGGMIQKFKNAGRVKKLKVDGYTQNIANAKNPEISPNSILNESSVGVAILKNPSEKASQAFFESTRVSKKNIIKSVSSKYSNLLQSSLSGSLEIKKQSLSPAAYMIFDSAIEKGLVQAVNTAVGAVGKQFPNLPVPAISDATKQKYLAGVNDAAKGNLFEEILTSMRNKGVYDDKPDPQRPFDFNNGLGDASELFPLLKTLKFVDAKASNPSNDNIAKKIANQTLKDIGVSASRKSNTGAMGLDQNLSEQSAAIRAALAEKTGGYSTDEIRRKFGLGAKELATIAGIEKKGLYWISKGMGSDSFVKRAAGGSISGEDTVPALLTPGEFVINKKAASRIGAAKLHRLNRADKIQGFNKGGVVQRFADGGPAGLLDVDALQTSASGSLLGSNRDFSRGLGLFTTNLKNFTRNLQADATLMAAIGQTAATSGRNFNQLMTAMRGAPPTLRQLETALQRDIAALRAAGASADIVAQREQALITVREAQGAVLDRLAAQKEGRVSQALSGITDRLTAVGDRINSIPGIGGASRFVSNVGRGLGGNAGFYGSMALGMLAGQGQNIFGNKTATAAGRSAGFESGVSTLATGMATASSLAIIPGIGPFLAGFTALTSVVMAGVSAFKANKEAVEEFNRNLRNKKAEDASDALSRALNDLAKDANNVDLQNKVSSRLRESLDATSATTGDVLNEQRKNAQADAVAKMGTLEWLGSFVTGGMPQAALGTQNYNDAAKGLAPRFEAQQRAAMVNVERAMKGGATVQDIATSDKYTAEREAIVKSDQEALAKILPLIDQEAKLRAQGNNVAADAVKEQQQTIITQSVLNNATVNAAAKTIELEKAMEEANRAGRQLALSFDRLADSIDQSINRIQYEAKERQKSVASFVNAIRGQAATQEVDLKEINVLENPLAYSSEDRIRAAKSAGNMLGGKQGQMLESGIRVQTELPDLMTNAIAEKLKGAANLDPTEAYNIARDTGVSQIRSMNLSPDVERQLISQFEGNLKQTKDKVSKDEFTNNPNEALDKFIESVRDVDNALGEVGRKIVSSGANLLKATQGMFNDFSKNLSEASKAAKMASNYFKAARDIRYQGDMSLREAQTGVGETFAEAQTRFNKDIASLTGGTTDPAAISKNIENLAAQQKTQQDQYNNALASGDRDSAKKFAEDLDKTNNSLNDNREALDKLANSADLAQKALDEVKNVRGLQQNREDFVNRLLTNTPEEADKLNQTFIRLQRNLSGGLNDPSNQRDARNAFNDTLRKTGSLWQAARAGNTVLAEQRKETLGLMQDPGFRGMMTLQMKNRGMDDNQIQQNFRDMEGRLMYSMAAESGMLRNPLVQQALAAKNDPNADPAMQQAANQFLQTVGIQAKATEEQARLEQINSQKILTEANKQLKDSIDQLKASIDRSSGIANTAPEGVDDANPDVGAIAGITGPRVPLNLGLAGSLGTMYASKGQYVNFEPRGSDTVPAMLTPGEFVVNARATAEHLPLLKAINSGSSIVRSGYMSKGGVVYLADGSEDPIKRRKTQEPKTPSPAPAPQEPTNNQPTSESTPSETPSADSVPEPMSESVMGTPDRMPGPGAYDIAKQQAIDEAKTFNDMRNARLMAIQTGQFDPGPGSELERRQAASAGMTVQEMKYAEQQQRLNKYSPDERARRIADMQKNGKYVEPSPMMSQYEKTQQLTQGMAAASQVRAVEDRINSMSPEARAEYERSGGGMPVVSSDMLAFQAMRDPRSQGITAAPARSIPLTKEEKEAQKAARDESRYKALMAKKEEGGPDFEFNKYDQEFIDRTNTQRENAAREQAARVAEQQKADALKAAEASSSYTTGYETTQTESVDEMKARFASEDEARKNASQAELQAKLDKIEADSQERLARIRSTSEEIFGKPPSDPGASKNKDNVFAEYEATGGYAARKAALDRQATLKATVNDAVNNDRATREKAQKELDALKIPEIPAAVRAAVDSELQDERRARIAAAPAMTGTVVKVGGRNVRVGGDKKQNEERLKAFGLPSKADFDAKLAQRTEGAVDRLRQAEQKAQGTEEMFAGYREGMAAGRGDASAASSSPMDNDRKERLAIIALDDQRKALEANQTRSEAALAAFDKERDNMSTFEKFGEEATILFNPSTWFAQGALSPMGIKGEKTAADQSREAYEKAIADAKAKRETLAQSGISSSAEDAGRLDQLDKKLAGSQITYTVNRQAAEANESQRIGGLGDQQAKNAQRNAVSTAANVIAGVVTGGAVTAGRAAALGAVEGAGVAGFDAAYARNTGQENRSGAQIARDVVLDAAVGAATAGIFSGVAGASRRAAKAAKMSDEVPVTPSKSVLGRTSEADERAGYELAYQLDRQKQEALLTKADEDILGLSEQTKSATTTAPTAPVKQERFRELGFNSERQYQNWLYQQSQPARGSFTLGQNNFENLPLRSTTADVKPLGPESTSQLTRNVKKAGEGRWQGAMPFSREELESLAKSYNISVDELVARMEVSPTGTVTLGSRSSLPKRQSVEQRGINARSAAMRQKMAQDIEADKLSRRDFLETQRAEISAMTPEQKAKYDAARAARTTRGTQPPSESSITAKQNAVMKSLIAPKPVTSIKDLMKHKNAKLLNEYNGFNENSLENLIEIHGPLVKNKDELIDKLGGRKALSSGTLEKLDALTDDQAKVFDIGNRSWTQRGTRPKAYRQYSKDGGAVGPWDSNRFIKIGDKEQASYMMGKSNVDELYNAFYNPNEKDKFGRLTNFQKHKLVLEMLQDTGYVHKYATGGLVYASNGALISAQQRGTDTVPAMLTPGEFVINREQAQKFLPLLQSINNGQYPNYMANGGLVVPNSMDQGGNVPSLPSAVPGSVGGVSSSIDTNGLAGAISNLQSALGKVEQFVPSMAGALSEAIGGMGGFVGSLQNTVGSFGQVGDNLVQGLSEALGNMPGEVKVSVNHFGLGGQVGNNSPSINNALAVSAHMTNSALRVPFNNLNKGQMNSRLEPGVLGPDISSLGVPLASKLS